MRVFSVVLFAHLLSAMALFVGYGIEWVSSALFRKASSVEQVRAWLRVFRVSPPLAGAGLGMLLLSGGYLAWRAGLMKEGWIPATLLGIGVALLLGFAVILPRMVGIRKSLPAQDAPISTDLRARLTDPILLSAIRVRVMLAAGIVFLMAAKMPIGPSLVAMTVALIAGVLFSIPVLRRPA